MPRKIAPIDRDNVPGAIGDAYRAGHEAYKSGLAFRSDNPYKRGTDCRAMWLAGWNAAEKQANERIRTTDGT